MRSLLLTLALIATASARAEEPTPPPETNANAPANTNAPASTNAPAPWPGKHELSAHVGYHLGFGGQVGDGAGFKITGDYGYRFHRLVWFDVQLSQLFGFGARDGACLGNSAAICYRGGWATQIAAGVKLKIQTKIPITVEVPILLGLTGIYNRECGDDGVAIPLFRSGVGMKYFVRPRIGIGAQVNVDLGPAFHDGTACKGGGRYTDFYGTFDFMLGAEFIL